MSENKYCGNCKHFTNEDINGFGWCSRVLTRTRCSSGICREYEMPNNGWTEITPDNVYMIDDGSIVIVTDGTYYNEASEWYLDIGTMAKRGGYYYYVLPELKIE